MVAPSLTTVSSGVDPYQVTFLLINVPLLVVPLAIWSSLEKSVPFLIAKGRMLEAKAAVEKIVEEVALLDEVEGGQGDAAGSGLLEDEEETDTADNGAVVDDHSRGACVDDVKIHPSRTRRGQWLSSLPIFQLFNRNLRKTTLILILSWIVNVFLYYGLLDLAADMGGDVGLIIAASIEVPCYVVAVFMVESRIGRRYTLASLVIASGVFCGLAGIPGLGGDAQQVAVQASRGFVTASFAVIYPYTAELYHSKMRGSAVLLCASVCRIVAIGMPVILVAVQPSPPPVDPMCNGTTNGTNPGSTNSSGDAGDNNEMNYGLTILLFSIALLGIVSGISSAWLRETRGVVLT